MALLARILAGLFFATAVVQTASAGEWKLIPRGQDHPFVLAFFVHDDGGELAIVCDTRTNLISLGITEPRANWQPGAPVRVVTKPDSTIPLGQTGDPDGIAIESTLVAVKNPATLHLSSMALADSFFAVTAGDYGRLYPIAGFKRITGQVLEACGDHW